MIQEILPEIIKIRHEIHKNPELKFEEKATALLVVKTLQSYGYEVSTGIGGTGVSAILDSGKSGKTVALRADMDALPIVEETELSYQSKNKGKMHACGHDGHTATLLAIASVLKKCTDLFRGKIKFIFQPAEEVGAGAASMIKDGILENPKVDAIFGYHNWPGIKAGKIASRKGCILAGLDVFTIKVNGRGGHAATPEKCIDPVYIGSAIIQNAQSIVSRSTSPNEAVVMSITEFHGGSAFNIIPDSITLSGCIRTTTYETQIKAKDLLKQIAESTAHTFGATVEVMFKDNYPVTINSNVEVDLALNTARNLFGENQLIACSQPLMYSEDFSCYLQKVPGCFLLIGNGEDSAPPHTAKYNFQDEIIPIATELLSHIAINYLRGGA